VFPFSKSLRLAIFFCVAIIAVPSPAPAQIQGRLIYGHFPDPHVTVPIPAGGGIVSTHTPNGNVPIKIGTFTVSIFLGTSSGKLPNQTAMMEMKAVVTGGTLGEVLTLQLTDTGFSQTGLNSFFEGVSGTITGAGSVSFQAFKDFTNTPFGMAGAPNGATPGLLGPFPDLGFAQSMAVAVQDNSDYSMTMQAVINGGDVSFDFVSTDGPLTPTTTTVASSLNPSFVGQGVTFTATVAPQTGNGIPTGTVQFMIDNTNFGSPVTLVNGTATSASAANLAIGMHTVMAVYSGDSIFASSTGTVTQTVNGIP
jgi:hypothetical protein